MHQGWRVVLAVVTAGVVTVLVAAFDVAVSGVDLHLGWCALIGAVVSLLLWYGCDLLDFLWEWGH